MKPGLMVGVTPHAKDGEIVRAINSAKRRLSGSGDSVIAIKNEEGMVYRHCVISGLQQEMYLAERMEALGLVDETMQGGRKPKGIWAVYGAGLDLSLEAMIAKLKTKDKKTVP